MTHGISNVAVKHLPEVLSAKQACLLLDEIESCMDADRPRMVVDCSHLREMGNASIHFLLCCLEEAMKRNGDVKLAALPRGAATIFGVTGVDRLFEVFETVDDAVGSFYRLPMNTSQFTGMRTCAHRIPEDAK